MRILAFIPAILSLTALILTFLALFAGSKRSFMQDYGKLHPFHQPSSTPTNSTLPNTDILTLNTSRIGHNTFNTTTSESSNPVASFIDDLTNDLQSAINENLNSLAQNLGLNDFYSVHVLNHCQGFYTPAAISNATLDDGDIDRNVTRCSRTRAMYDFDPEATLQKQLDESGLAFDVDLEDLDWPEEIDQGMRALAVAQHAVFILYCITIAFIFVALVASLACVFVAQGRVGSFVNVVLDLLAFLAVGIASGIVTAVAMKAAELINRYGDDVGVSAQRGGKFLAVTWAATALMLLSSSVWCFECVKGRRERGTGYGTAKRLP